MRSPRPAWAARLRAPPHWRLRPPLRLALLACAACGGGGGGGGATTVVAPDGRIGPDAPAQLYDFQPEGLAPQAGFTAVTPATLYDPQVRYGFTVPPESAVDGTGHGWTIFDDFVSVTEAIPPSVLSEATIDCVSSAAGPIVFRADVAPGLWDVVVWLGDVTTPRHQVRVTLNGATLDAQRLDINDRRGSFDQAPFGNAVPLLARVDAADGVIELSVGSHPDGAQAVTWTYLQDEDPDNPPEIKTATLVPAFSAAPLAALVLHPAEALPLALEGGKLVVEAAPVKPALKSALAEFNAGDLDAAAEAFLALDDAALAEARAAGLLWVAGHPASVGRELDLLDAAFEQLGALLADDPSDWSAALLALDVRRALEAETFRAQYGYSASGAPAAENLGRSCSLVEPFFSGEQAYGRKGQVLWLRNRGGLDPRRVTVSWERAQWLAKELEAQWGDLNPHVRLYARDEWIPDGQPWKVIDWGELAGPGPAWAKDLMRNLNTWLDLFEWWVIQRQSIEGDIGGGWTDDVEIVPAFGVLAWALEGASDVVEAAVGGFADGLWDSGVIDTGAAYQAAYADVEHTAEATGNMLHVVPLLRFGDPVSIERILTGVRTFDELFLTPADGGHRHMRGNHLSATQIALDGDHRLDIPLCARITAPFAFALWHSGNPGVEAPLRDWVEAWVADAASTVGGKPAGVFPHGVWAPTDTLGSPWSQGWWAADPEAGQFYDFPAYHDLLYGLAGTFYLRTGEASFRVPFDALAQVSAAWSLAGQPLPGAAPPPGDEDLWAGALLAEPMSDAASNLALASGSSDWDAYLAAHGGPYTQFRLAPSSVNAFPDLAGAANGLTSKWPYKTTEGVMTDRILDGGWADVLGYYVGAEMLTAVKGMPVQAVSWSGSSRLFAAAVTAATPEEVRATTYLFQDTPRTVTLRCWQLEPGAGYRLRAGPATTLGQPATSIDQVVLFDYDQRGDGPAFTLPARMVYALEVTQVTPPAGPPPLLADVGLSASDLSYDADAGELTVRVHNVGAAAAPVFALRLLAGATPSAPALAQVAVPALAAPLDLLPRFVDIVLPHDGSSPVTVLLDPGGNLDEITTDNNRLTAWLDGDDPGAAPPQLLGLSTGIVVPDEPVTLTGRNFHAGCLVLIDLQPALAIVPDAVTDEELVFELPFPLVGASLHLVSVLNPDGSASNPLAFRVDT